MSSFGAVRTASGGLLRHKVSALVICAVLLISTASATLGFALLAATNGPFNSAFAAQRGADVTLTVTTSKATGPQLAGTANVKGVTASAGPFGEAQLSSTQLDGQPFGGITLTGRAAPGGPVDDLVLNAGHWLTGAGQVVMDGSPQPGGPQPLQLGTVITAGTQKLTVVGFANSITGSEFGWVTPAEITALRTSGAEAAGLPAGTAVPQLAQMEYRFSSAANYTQIDADIAGLTGALPKGTISTSANWLTAQQNSEGNGAIMEPFVVAFAVIGLAMAVLIVANVVSGAVAAQYQRIGVLKSIGMAPRQVVAVYLGRIGLPAVIGVIIGVALGDVLSVPLLSDSAGAYGVGSQSAPLWALVAAPLGMLALTMLAAFVPALRAGRLSATAAIAAGRAPRAGRGYLVHRIASRLGLPRPVGIGLAQPFARPGRTLVTLAAIAFGATAVIFAVGLNSGLGQAAQAQTHSAAAPVLIEQNLGQAVPGAHAVKAGPGSGPQPPTAAQTAQLASVLSAQPGTARYIANYTTPVRVSGISGQVTAQVYGGDASWLDFGMISGRWAGGAGQVDVSTAFLTQSGLKVGDTTTVTVPTAGVLGQGPNARFATSRQVTVTIAGEIFAPSSQPRIVGGPQSLPGAATAANLNQYYVGLKPGTNVAGYVRGLNGRFGGSGAWQAMPGEGGGTNFYTVAGTLIGLLALMVAIAAGLGVLNTVLMTTRDKVHDMGIFKALGMRPGQTLTMVVCSVIPPAIIAGAIAAPAAVALTTATIKAMAGTAHTAVPASFTDVFDVSRLALLALAAVVIAVLGALLPASWAARSRPATALRAE
jgi:putative ABC transport system permease protein